MRVWEWVTSFFTRPNPPLEPQQLQASSGVASTVTVSEVDGIVSVTRAAPAIPITIAVKAASSAEPVALFTLNLQTSVTFTHDEVLADLNRRATDAKEQKNWPEAISLAQQAKARQGNMYQDTRLAMYLQHGGRFEEAMVEFEWLLAQVPAQVDASAVPNSAKRRQSDIARMNAKVHDKIRVAAKREKRPDLVSKHQALVDQYQGEVDKLASALEREWQAQRRAYDKREAARVKRLVNSRGAS